MCDPAEPGWPPLSLCPGMGQDQCWFYRLCPREERGAGWSRVLSLECWKAGAPSSLPTTSKPRDIVPGEAAGGRQGRGRAAGARTRGGRAGRVPCAGVPLPVPLPAPRQRPCPALPRRAPPGWPAAGRGGGRSRQRRSRAGFLAGRAGVAAWAGP